MSFLSMGEAWFLDLDRLGNIPNLSFLTSASYRYFQALQKKP